MRFFIGLFICAVLTACSGDLGQGSLPAEAQKTAYVTVDGPPKLTLITVINNRSGSGGHSALMISGAHRVIFDPAGSYRHGFVTEHGDVLYGISDIEFRRFRSAHARIAYHVMTQEIEVPSEVAAQALALVEANGAVPDAHCAQSISKILKQLPGFEDIRPVYFPNKLAEQFSNRPAVLTERYYEDDEGDIIDGVKAAEEAAKRG
jgi:hypothetical protein